VLCAERQRGGRVVGVCFRSDCVFDVYYLLILFSWAFPSYSKSFPPPHNSRRAARSPHVSRCPPTLPRLWKL
jgi:hypothetical protein